MVPKAIVFRQMPLIEFSKFRRLTLDDYAQEIARNFKRPLNEVRVEARKQFKQILSNGIHTRGHFLYDVFDAETGEAVGFTWFKVDKARGIAFLYSILIHKLYRGRGYGRQTMALLETTLRNMGVRQLALHVFAQNRAAINLYKTQDFYTASLNMQKDL
jgi:ribosomal protein S18 acetylase RimI-like enzyme